MGLASDISRDVGAMFNRQIPRTYGAIKGMSTSAKILKNQADGMAGHAAATKNAAYGDLKDLYTKMKQTRITGDPVQAGRIASAAKNNHADPTDWKIGLFDDAGNPIMMSNGQQAWRGLQTGEIIAHEWMDKVSIFFANPNGQGGYDKTRIALAAIGGVLGTAAATRVGMNAVEGNY